MSSAGILLQLMWTDIPSDIWVFISAEYSPCCQITYLIAWRIFCCFYSHSKRWFYRSFNAIFGKIGRVSSEDVVIQLMKSKCLPSLYYGTDVCPVKKSQLQSFEFVISSSFRKIFNVQTQELVNACISTATLVGAVVQLVEYRTRNQEVAASTHTRSTASNFELVANLLRAQANSASYPQWDGKWIWM